MLRRLLNEVLPVRHNEVKLKGHAADILRGSVFIDERIQGAVFDGQGRLKAIRTPDLGALEPEARTSITALVTSGEINRANRVQSTADAVKLGGACLGAIVFGVINERFRPHR